MVSKLKSGKFRGLTSDSLILVGQDTLALNEFVYCFKGKSGTLKARRIISAIVVGGAGFVFTMGVMVLGLILDYFVLNVSSENLFGGPMEISGFVIGAGSTIYAIVSTIKHHNYLLKGKSHRLWQYKVIDLKLED